MVLLIGLLALERGVDCDCCCANSCCCRMEEIRWGGCGGASPVLVALLLLVLSCGGGGAGQVRWGGSGGADDLILPLLMVFVLPMLSWLFDTIELEDVVLVSVATLFAEPLLTSFDLSSSATALATLFAEPKFGSVVSGAKLMGKCDRLVLETLRTGGGGGGFMAGGFGGGAAGRPIGLFCLDNDSDDVKLDGGPRSVPK